MKLVALRNPPNLGISAIGALMFAICIYVKFDGIIHIARSRYSSGPSHNVYDKSSPDEFRYQLALLICCSIFVMLLGVLSFPKFGGMLTGKEQDPPKIRSDSIFSETDLPHIAVISLACVFSAVALVILYL